MIGAVAPTRTIDARGSAEPLVELIRAIRRAEAGEAIAVITADRASRTEIPRWVEKAGHALVDVDALEEFDRFVVVKRA
jgi:TusA-related sulfurtransferase